MDSFGIPYYTPADGGLPKDERAITRMRAAILTHEGFRHWIATRKGSKNAQRRPVNTSPDAPIATAPPSAPVDTKVEVKNKSKQKKKEKSRREALDRKTAKEAQQATDSLLESKKEQDTLDFIRKGAQAPDHGPDDRQCPDCHSWWSLWQTTFMTEELYPWAGCEHCDQWWCPKCRDTAAVDLHQTQCNSQLPKRAKLS